MKRRSSGSAEDSAPACIETTRSREPSKLNDQRSTARRSPSSPDEHQYSSTRATSARNRTSTSNVDWKATQDQNGFREKESSTGQPLAVTTSSEDDTIKGGKGAEWRPNRGWLSPSRSPWAISLLTLFSSIIGIALLCAVLRSSTKLHCDVKGCRMSYMRPSYIEFNDFDTEHTRFASKYSLYLYREDGISYDGKISGIPVLFIPGNAGSYKQVRPIASEAANYFHNVLQHDTAATDAGIKNLDFFTVDFNEDFTAFDGQTMLDQAEYVNEAIRYILSLYLDPRLSDRDPDLPDPTSVIVLGHSMGGIVARTMLIMPNYQPDSINTIITMSAPHARPPVTFDPQIVQIYEDINRHWRDSYSQQWADNNPLRQVTLVSIAGGGLDTVVPSDYASLESIVPDTHGFTVFTSTIPNVWTSMDHQAITWCDQFRKVITRALYEIVDIGHASQTRPRAERMGVFKKWFLTGLENVAEKTVTQKKPNTFLTFEDGSKPTIVPGERLTLRRLGIEEGPRTHLLTIPSGSSANAKSFTLLSNAELNSPGDEGPLEVLLCSAHPPEPGQAEITFTMDVDLSNDDANDGSVKKLICHNAASDVVALPASTRATANPFFVDGEMRTQPFSYLQYDLKGIAGYQYVAVVDNAGSRTSSWVVAEFSDRSASHSTSYIGLKQLLAFGLQLRLPSKRPMVTEIHIPSVESSLLAYNLEIEGQGCSQHDELFAPLGARVLLAQHMARRQEKCGVCWFHAFFTAATFAYVVACLIQLGTSVRAFWFARSVPSSSNVNFSNYVHSVFLLMFWVLPVNLPTLVVWVRNLAIHWFTPISCHHNLVSILPFVLLVETLTAGRMVPRVPGPLRHVTSSLLFGTAVYAAIYGVSYAYTIHSLVNAVAAWLVVVHSTADPWPLSGLTDLFDSGMLEDSKQRKKP
ncbi:hypothetical protein DL770_003523 [Monosporascus sp. CRB-9-2]|nr:hypothetical protein DL770_003523 [Monosporascus sp. CRB-9-2]